MCSTHSCASYRGYIELCGQSTLSSFSTDFSMRQSIKCACWPQDNGYISKGLLWMLQYTSLTVDRFVNLKKSSFIGSGRSSNLSKKFSQTIRTYISLYLCNPTCHVTFSVLPGVTKDSLYTEHADTSRCLFPIRFWIIVGRTPLKSVREFLSFNLLLLLF